MLRPITHSMGRISTAGEGLAASVARDPGATDAALALGVRATDAPVGSEPARIAGPGAAIEGARSGARLLRSTTPPSELARMERVLRDGQIVPGSEVLLDARGATGLLTRATLVDAADPTLRIDVVLKRSEAPQEEFGYRITRALGIDDLTPHTQVREDGRAAIEFIDGAPFDEAGIPTGAELRRAFEARYVRSGADPATAARSARVDHELLEFSDWLSADRDRKYANTIRRFGDGIPTFIDRGGAFRGERADALRPRLKDALYLASGGADVRRIELSPDTLDVIRERLGHDELRAAHGALRRPVTEPMQEYQRLNLARARSDHQLERLIARRDAALRDGAIEYAPVTPESRRAESAAYRAEVAAGTFDTWGGTA